MKRNQVNFTAPPGIISDARRKSQQDYGKPLTESLRIILTAFVDGRLTITKPKNQKDIYND